MSDIAATETTEIERLRAEIHRLRNEADARKTFLATVSHEIREPMNGVLGMARLLRDSALEPEQARFVDAIVDSGEALLTIINDILDISKVDAGRLELVEMDVDLRQFFDRLSAILEPRAKLKGLEFAIEIAEDAPALVRVDPGRLRQILINLCGNGIKFTDHGRVGITVERLADDTLGENCGGGISLTVHDTGPGVPDSLKPKLFTAFSQADATMPRLYGGSGLGLMIVGRLVQAMGGRITVLSEAGQGASFRVDLPLQAPVRSDAALDRSVAVSGSSALLIDSEDRGRADIEMMLKSWKVSCRCVASIEQATAILEDALDRGEPYDVILVADDGHLHNVLAFVERVREDVRSAGCSIVVMASSGLRGDAATASAAGADAYLRKPLDAERLLRCMQSLGNWDRNRDGIMTVHTIDDQKPSSFDILVVDDNALNCKLAEVLLSRAGHRVAIAANGVEALERVEAEHFDIVLMDIQMPVMNGLDATGAIRRLGDEAKSRIPIVAITANAMDGDARKCRDAGMNDYVTKPINGPDLLAVVDRAVRTVG